MSQKSKIKNDEYGLYLFSDGKIFRPFFGTSFELGDEVKAHHFDGDIFGGVTSLDKPKTHHFKRGGQYEVWILTGVAPSDYRFKKVPSDLKSKFASFEDYLKHKTEWYKNHAEKCNYPYKEENKKFVK